MNWTRGKLIGHGSSAAVSLAKSLPSGEIFAVKSMEYSRSNALQKEQEIHSSLKCGQIIDYKGFDVTHENGKVLYNIFLEYASGGTLIDAVYEKGSGLSDSLVRQYTGEILRGLEYMHCRGMVHCDIKGANILVTSEGAKIGDFGWDPLVHGPEVARGEQQSYPADVWALGCTVVEMATGLSPWPNITQDPLSALYHIGFSGALPEIPDFLSDQAKDFLSQCLKRDPKERWSVAELLKHPFIIHNGPDHGPKSYTPTSILDQDIWETLKEARSHEAQERPIKSPNERIKELMVDSSSDKFPNWAWDDDWITHRIVELLQGYNM
ncbi:Mitogen-activated protein kinase kinase kinase 18 [Bienertia sinuspersici]